MSLNKQSSYRTILKSSTMIGGASAVNMLLGAVRTKFMAVLLGPVGVGVMGTYTTITTMTSTLAGLGIGTSGVRQIAEAAGTNDAKVISRTIMALRRSVIVLGVVGTLGLALLSGVVSQFTFKSREHAWPIAILAITVFFASVSSGQVALVQGLRRIGDLSRINVMSGVISTLFGIPLVLWLKKDAIVPLLLGLSAMTILTSWWYARKIPVDDVQLTWRETWHESRGMLKLGLAFLVSGALVAIAAYVIRVVTMRQLGAAAVGQYQAAFTLSGLYAGFILQSMGADFYPRLTAVSKDNAECNRLVNEQSEVSLLLAGPGILATLALAPLVIHVFYAASFLPAVALLRWFSLGLLLRVIAWPMGFIMLAKGLGTLFVYTEIASYFVYVALTFVGVRWVGLSGTSMAFVGLYLFCLPLYYLIAWKLTRFGWSRSNLVYGGVTVGAALAVFGLSFVLNEIAVAVIGCIAALISGLFSLKRLAVALRGSRFENILSKVERMLNWLTPKWLGPNHTL